MEQIFHIARDRNLAVAERTDAAAILSALAVESPIPIAALVVVAEILARLYRQAPGEGELNQ